MKVSLFSQVMSCRTRGKTSVSSQGRFRILGKALFTERVIKSWSRLLRKEVESPSLEVFKRYVDVVLGDMF